LVGTGVLWKEKTEGKENTDGNLKGKGVEGEKESGRGSRVPRFLENPDNLGKAR